MVHVRLRPALPLCALALLCGRALVSASGSDDMSSTLREARLVEPDLAKQVLAHTCKLSVDRTSGGSSWLTDLRAFDSQERAEMSELMKVEGLALSDRSKLRRMLDQPILTVASVQLQQPMGALRKENARTSPDPAIVRRLQDSGSGLSSDSITLMATAALGTTSFIVQAITEERSVRVI